MPLNDLVSRITVPREARSLWRCAALVGALVLAGGSHAAELEPPGTEEVQEAYARFLAGVVGKLEAAGAPVSSASERQAQVNVFARRMKLRDCDRRGDTWPDPFASADATPPVVFHCTWESGERISLTRSANTGAWAVSDDATAAAGAGVLLVGPKVDGPTVADVQLAPKAPNAAPVPAATPIVQVPQVASAVVAPVRLGADGLLQAMPSPYVPPTRSEAPMTLASPQPPSKPGAMPAPYASR
ncbi:MAG: hypothetical protein WA159_12880 [Variovorax sp.]